MKYFFVLACAFGFMRVGFAVPIGVVGGTDNDLNDPYAALVSSTGETIALTGDLPVPAGSINDVAINSSGVSIVGGGQEDFSTPYAVFVSPEGEATAITGLPVSGSILSVAINDSKQGLIGGVAGPFGSPPYAAIVSPEGVATELTGPGPTGNGTMGAAAINNLGAGVIGGQDNGNMRAYAALVSSAGVRSAITGIPTGNGGINSVAINSSGDVIIGGVASGFNTPYAALVALDGTATAIAGIPLDGEIRSVAINDSQKAIIGGADADSLPYAALVSPEGMLIALTGPDPVGFGNIFSVAINSLGVAIIGGQDNDATLPYIALVSPEGLRSSITGEGLPMDGGYISSVAINDEGVALVGGQDHDSATAYIALVSPSGVATALTGSALPVGGGDTLSVAISNGGSSPTPILDLVVPRSFGPGSGFAISLFALTSQVLPNHLIHQTIAKSALAQEEKNHREMGYLVDAADIVRLEAVCNREVKCSFWSDLFGSLAHQDRERNIPALSYWIGGGALGFDYLGIQDVILGSALCYAFNYAHVSEQIGHAKTHQEFLALYGTWNRPYFFLNAAIWAGPYQMWNERHTLAQITSTAYVTGWLLTPHLEIGTPFYAKERWLLIDPFVMVDWANNWQGHVREEGASGLNLRFGNTYTSLLRSEVGIRFFEIIRCEWGKLVLQEKGSYINKLPFETGNITTAFVGAVSSFGIELFSSEVQNLGAAQLNIEFLPDNCKYPYGSLNYQGEFGSSFQSHLLSFEIGWLF